MSEVIRVGMGEYAIARAPGQIVTLGLGSCVGVTFYDPVLKLGGMVHIMLPDSGAARGRENNPAKFADTAIPFLLAEMERHGAVRERLVVKMVGGAQMFSTLDKTRESIGLRNVAAVEEALREAGLTVAAKSVGGTQGKSVSFDLETGEIRLRTVQVDSLPL
ncbi:MAG: chemotaxis protein CheD [Firmicutes bacterium]|nr:chemotaxis protein CheD [Bacillota bacterium]